MSNDKSNSCSSSASSEKKSKNSHSPSYSPVTYILGKRTRERESSSSDSFNSSDSSAQSIMWKEEWDEPYLDLLDRVTLRQFKGMKVFDNKLWHRFAQVLQEEVGSKEFDGNDCLRRGVSLRREYRKMVIAMASSSNQPMKLSSNLSKIKSLGLDQDKRNIMDTSVFSKLVKIENGKESSATLVHELACLFDGKNTFRAPAESLPEYLMHVETKSDSESSGIVLTSSKLKTFLKEMKIENENDRIMFRKLLTLYLLDQVLFPSTFYQKVQSKFFWLVDDLEMVNTINWAQAVFDHLVHALGSARKFFEEGKGKQHVFDGAAPVLEAIIFGRIPKIAPSKIGRLDPPPIQIYNSKRAKSWELTKLTSDEILPCLLCPILPESDDAVPSRILPTVEDGTSSSAACGLATSFETMTMNAEPRRSNRERKLTEKAKGYIEQKQGRSRGRGDSGA